MTKAAKIKGLVKDKDGKTRCWWHGGKDDYRTYHDTEWGVPQDDDFLLFEKICLEGFQAGLSWLIILRKRENFRKAFCNFNFNKIAKFTKRDVNRLVKDAGIVRHRGKIESTINNAKRAVEMVSEHGSLGKWFWQFEPSEKDRPKKITYQAINSKKIIAPGTELSKQLKKRGWSFVGPTTCYAFMQAMGLVNDHLEGCDYRKKIQSKRKKFKRP